MMFMVRPRLFATACVAAVLAAALACSSTPGSPTSPSGTSPVGSSAIGDLSLKSNAPTLVAPEHDFEFDSGSTVTLQFQAARASYVTSTLEHQIQIRNNADGQVVYEATVSGSGTVSHELPPVPTGSFEWRVRGFSGDGAGPWAAARSFTMKAPSRGPVSRGGPRTPDPPPGVRLPPPDMYAVVAAVANQYYGFLLNSCQEHGGTWDFMDVLVDTLRTFDTRFGYNWKRGVVGDASQDIVDYNWSADPDEGTRNVYTFDVIVGHCGSGPGPNWANTQPGGGPGLSAWTGRGRF
jgi:hypothetical protein